MPEISEEQLKELQAAAEKAKLLEASKSRLEEENSKIKARAQAAEGKLSDAEKAKLEEEGKYQDLLAKEREERKRLEEKYQLRGKSTLKEKLKAEVLKHAKDVHDVDMLLKVTDHKDLLKINEDELTVAGVEDFVGACRETHKFLFGNKKMPDYDNTKGGNGDDDNGDDHTKDDEQRYREEIAKCNTRKEYNEIRKKYGKPVDSYLGNY